MDRKPAKLRQNLPRKHIPATHWNIGKFIFLPLHYQIRINLSGLLQAKADGILIFYSFGSLYINDLLCTLKTLNQLITEQQFLKIA